MCRWTSHKKYSNASAYHAFFVGQSGIPGVALFCKTRASQTCKFLWLVLLRSLLDVREAPTPQFVENSGPCVLCAQEDKAIHHLLPRCCFSREVWYMLLKLLDLLSLHLCIVLSWISGWSVASAPRKHGENTLTPLLC
jgi:hypothetical protein